MKQLKLKDNHACEGCHHCCSTTHFQLKNEPKSLAMAEYWGNEILWKGENDPWICLYNPCKHLDKDGFCDDYDNRPAQCRLFPTGKNDLYINHCRLMREKFNKEK